ncbi:rod-binding protein [Borreliella lusitaniae]|uniref:Rod-binding protein n=1 Tax=Borreliella lusitaniae TaxID=100177 RepID=A0ABZ0CIQ3_9SPIR|nr:rod-binding protein [Borreliella lusitaniae]WKC85658.1 rod-binding protein [Borreliella lusitaniae]WNY67097.1 rod-binding protein [Borreliella lusitaniae]WNY68946.1 rod-binding protein [Borreliella lusitaniae]
MESKINLQNLKFKNQINNFKNPVEIKSSQKNKELKKAALEFEAIFIKQMLESMKKTLNKNQNLLNGGQVEEIFEDMLYEQRAKQMAESQSFGIANLIYNQLQKK